jgi:hypothetical protein
MTRAWYRPVRLRRAGAAAVLSTLLLVATAQPASAADAAATVRYVATPANGGSDSNACTQAAPCATVQRAVAVSTAGGTVHVGAGTFPTQLDLTGSAITIVGAGQKQTFLDGGGVSSVIDISQGDFVSPITITDLTIQHGNDKGNDARNPAGGIFFLRGSLTLDRVTVSRNTGEGIFNEGSVVTIRDSTVSDNTGIGLQNFEGNSDVSGSTFMRNAEGISDESCCNSTFTNDTIARNVGDGFSAFNTSKAVITASTIADNGGVGIFDGLFIQGGAVFGVTVSATIVSNNRSGNCDISVGESDSGYFADAGYNLESDAARSCMFSSAKHDIVGADPQLDRLEPNGGPSLTMRPALTSPVVNAIPNPTSGLCPGTDQRGVARPQGTGCDIGAVERALPAPTPQGVIFAVTFPNCTSLHVGYNRFQNGTVVRWTVSTDGFGQVAAGSFTAIGGGSAGSKTFHFLTQPLGTTLRADPVHSHAHFTWTGGGKYVASRNPVCPSGTPAPPEPASPSPDVSRSV